MTKWEEFKSIWRKDLLPDYIKSRFHDDWIFPISLIPRRWTSFCFPMPPGVWKGNGQMSWKRIQKGYPLSDDAELNTTKDFVYSADPVYPLGGWAILSCKPFSWLPRIPCFFTISFSILGKGFHFNIGLKPDVTYGDWHWGFPEASLTTMD